MTDSVYSLTLHASANPSDAVAAWPWGEFLGDETNALAPVAAEAAMAASSPYNPLVFWGPSGVGKSHLAHGLMKRWQEAHPHAKAISLAGADFARSYAHAVQTDTLAEHRARIVQASWFLLDGLEELIKKPNAQQELIHTLDAALAEGVRVLVVSREALSPGSPFLPGLASRLSSGLVVPLAAPGLAARRAIVNKLVQALGVPWSAAAVDLLAAELPVTAPELRHAVLAGCAAAAGDEGALGAATVKRILTERAAQRRPTVPQIVAHVARRFRLKPAELLGTTRRREVVQARGVAMWLARRLTGASYQTVGRHFGGRDHSTVMHACRRIAERLNADPTLRCTVDELAALWTG